MWITTGEKPAVYGLKRPKMQTLLADVALALDKTTLQLNISTGFLVATYMADGDNYRLAANMFLPEQMESIVETMLAVVGNCVTSEDGVDRMSMLKDGLREGLTSLRVHCRKHRGKACLPENKALSCSLIDEDMKEYSQRLFSTSASAGKSGPPAIENMPPVVKPIWPALSAYIRCGELMAERTPAAAATGSARDEKRPRSSSSRGGGRGECYALRD